VTLGIARDISLIFLICPALLCALVPAAMAFGAWYVTWRAQRAMPPLFGKARRGLRRTRDAIDSATRVMTKPVYYGETQSARLRAMRRALRAGRRPRQENGL
jgi:hypothetical protein